LIYGVNSLVDRSENAQQGTTEAGIVSHALATYAPRTRIPDPWRFILGTAKYYTPMRATVEPIRQRANTGAGQHGGQHGDGRDVHRAGGGVVAQMAPP
jgi:chloramphenicol 3-O-phosphotransferase